MEEEAKNDNKDIAIKITSDLGINLLYIIEDKLNSLDSVVETLPAEDAIDIRIEQYEMCRLLVNAHNQNMLILVKGTTNLGYEFDYDFRETYLKARYSKQAYEHLSNALKLNNSLHRNSEEARKYHSHILTLMGQWYKEFGNSDSSLELLGKALTINKEISGEDNFDNAVVHNTMGEVYIKRKMYKEAIKEFSIAWELYEAKFGMRSEEVTVVSMDLANAYYKNQDYSEATEFQMRAFEYYKSSKNVDAKVIGPAAIKLGQIYSHSGKLDEAQDMFNYVAI